MIRTWRDWLLAIWTALAVVVVVLAFFLAPAWDVDSDAFVSGATIFVFLLFLTVLGWLAGLVILFVAVELGAWLQRRWRSRGKTPSRPQPH